MPPLPESPCCRLWIAAIALLGGLASSSCSAIAYAERLVPCEAEVSEGWRVSYRDLPPPHTGLLDLWAGRPGFLVLEDEHRTLELSAAPHRRQNLLLGPLLPILPWPTGGTRSQILLNLDCVRSDRPTVIHARDWELRLPDREPLRPYRVTRGTYPIGPGGGPTQILQEGDGVWFFYDVDPSQVDAFELRLGFSVPGDPTGSVTFRPAGALVVLGLFPPLGAP